jgi:hypothetical protein
MSKKPRGCFTLCFTLSCETTLLELTGFPIVLTLCGRELGVSEILPEAWGELPFGGCGKLFG